MRNKLLFLSAYKKRIFLQGFFKNARLFFGTACCFLASFSMIGCGRAYYMHEPIALIRTLESTGSVLFECAGPEEPTKIIGHYIYLDNGKPIFVENYSQQRVMISNGRHVVKIVSLKAAVNYQHKPGTIPDAQQVVEYGKPAFGSFFMIEEGSAVVRYTTSAVETESGQLWII